MIPVLFLALLATGAADKHPTRHKPPAKPVAPKPPPPPVEDDEPEDLADDTFGKTHDEPDDDEPFRPRHKRGDPDLTEQQAQALGVGGLCCCLVFLIALIAFIVWLVRRASTPVQKTAQAKAPPAAAPPPPGVPFQLSVLAVGMHATARQLVAQQLLIAGVQADPANATERTQLVRELAKAVRGLETEWTHFGYGERLDLADELAAQKSYQLAVEDFGRRSAQPGTGDSTYVVMTLVLCARRQLRGVSALDDRAQIRVLLDERAAMNEQDLMGAYIAWSDPLSSHEVLTRFPEMHAVR